MKTALYFYGPSKSIVSVICESTELQLLLMKKKGKVVDNSSDCFKRDLT